MSERPDNATRTRCRRRPNPGAGVAVLVLGLVVVASLAVARAASRWPRPLAGGVSAGPRRQVEAALSRIDGVVHLEAAQRGALRRLLVASACRWGRLNRLAWCRSERERRLSQDALMEWEVVGLGQVLRLDQMTLLEQYVPNYQFAQRRLAARASSAGVGQVVPAAAGLVGRDYGVGAAARALVRRVWHRLAG